MRTITLMVLLLFACGCVTNREPNMAASKAEISNLQKSLVGHHFSKAIKELGNPSWIGSAAKFSVSFARDDPQPEVVMVYDKLMIDIYVANDGKVIGIYPFKDHDLRKDKPLKP